jgi:hypothetical protein
VPAGQPHLRLPDLRFNRRIGRYANQPYDLDGNLLDADGFPEYLAAALPSDDDRSALEAIFTEPDWVVAREGRPPAPMSHS